MKIGFLLDQLTLNPKRLFLIDCLGAFLTSFFLGIMLLWFEKDFGMPRKALQPLSILACVYAVYSICCYFFVSENWRIFLHVIAIANLIYCGITIVFIVLFYQALTILGWVYFWGEIIIIGGLAGIEARTISKSNGLHITKRDP